MTAMMINGDVDNKNDDQRYLLLSEVKVRTESYRPSLFRSFLL